jgi:hypothetical protein
LLTSEKFNDYFFLARYISYLTKVFSISVVKRHGKYGRKEGKDRENTEERKDE